MASTVLVVTALEDITADRVVAALNEREVPVVSVVPFDPAGIGPALTFGFRLDADRPAWRGRLRTAPGPRISPGSTGTSATEARPGPGGVLNALSGARYFNDPATVARAESKPAQLRRLARRAPSNWKPGNCRWTRSGWSLRNSRAPPFTTGVWQGAASGSVSPSRRPAPSASRSPTPR
ncbi:hypothetical protein [Streptomyces sp. yara]|uniref:hypothetical protein n=1 Tax=Streptomyces sp. yara TaxID=3458421 RepID=UPI00403FC9E6